MGGWGRGGVGCCSSDLIKGNMVFHMYPCCLVFARIYITCCPHPLTCVSVTSKHHYSANWGAGGGGEGVGALS